MRSLDKVTVLASVVLCIVATAQADITFDFDSLYTTDSTTISNYMTGVYGSTVTVTDAKILNNDNTYYDWSGKSGTDSFLKTYTSDDMEILFSTPICKASGLGFVWDETIIGDDFHVRAYGNGYGDVENPADFIGQFSYNVHNKANPFSWCIDFSSPVYLLVISDNCTSPVGIDNLCVQQCTCPPPVPAPGAILLGGMGVSLVGWLRRRRSL